MQTIELQLAFRGGRDYLQGADIYEAMLRGLASWNPTGALQIHFHSLLRKQPDLVCSRQPLHGLRTEERYRGEAVVGAGEGRLHVVLMESDRPITERVPCNEEEVAAAACVDVASKSATLRGENPGSLMEMVVFLNKKLHFGVLPDVREKWLFVKLELKDWAVKKGRDELKLVIRQALGRRFTRTEIVVDGSPCGFITFSTIK